MRKRGTEKRKRIEMEAIKKTRRKGREEERKTLKGEEKRDI